MENNMNHDHNNSNDHEDESPSNLIEQTPDNMPLRTTVLMRAMTWNRESYGLFDYESKNLKKTDMQLEGEGMLVRTNTNVEFRDSSNDFPSNDQEETVLFKLIQVGKNYQVVPINTNQPNDRLWMVIRNFKENGYKIK